MFIINQQNSTNTISNNLIGSLTTDKSINVSSASASSLVKQDLYDIFTMNQGTTIISGNTICNLFDNYSGSNSGTKARGICTSYGSNTVENNVVRNISTNSAQVGSGLNATLVGISSSASVTGTTQSVNGNTVYNLSSLNTGVKTDVYGIYFYGPSNGTQTISKNFVHTLSAATSNTTSNIHGINISYGLANCSNNIIPNCSLENSDSDI